MDALGLEQDYRLELIAQHDNLPGSVPKAAFVRTGRSTWCKWMAAKSQVWSLAAARQTDERKAGFRKSFRADECRLLRRTLVSASGHRL